MFPAVQLRSFSKHLFYHPLSQRLIFVPATYQENLALFYFYVPNAPMWVGIA
jgi:hypothetical protein